MTWHRTKDVEQYLAAAGDLLFAEPGLHNVALTVAENVRARADGTEFAWWQEPDGAVTGAVSRTPPYPLLLAVVPEHTITALVELMEPDAVNGPTELAVQVAALAARASGRRATIMHAERLFRLGELTAPSVPGAARVAEVADRDLLIDWFQAFIDEAGVIPQDVPSAVDDRIGFGGMVLWEVDRQPVSLAGHTRVAFGVGRLGPVYTPPEHRTHGYGGAVTAAASQRLLDRGAWEVVLFTDLTNPTSNALYPRLGYVPLAERAVIQIS
jgi:predicted GNAT family acetyltransferase